MAAADRIDELRARYEENPRRFFALLANEYRKAGDLPRAIGLCRTHLAETPGNLSAYIVLGQALHDAGDGRAAREAFLRAVALDPENLIALRQLADLARHAGDRDEARRWYGRVLEADPRDAEVAELVAGLHPPIAAAPTAVPTPAPAPVPRYAPVLEPEPELDALDLAPPPAPLPSLADAPSAALDDRSEPTEALDAPRPGADDLGTEEDALLPGPDAFSFAMPTPAAVAEPSALLLDDEDPFAFEDAAASTPAPAPVPWPDEREEPMGMSPAALVDEAEPLSPEALVDDDEPLSPEALVEDGEPLSPPALVDEAEPRPPAEPVDDAEPRPPAPFATETMAELYLAQGLRQEAIAVYRRLLAQRPGDAQLEARLEAAMHPPAPADVPTARAFFAALAQRHPVSPPRPPARLFGDVPVPPADERVAALLAAAFGDAPPPRGPAGRPTHEADGAFRLDALFRPAPPAEPVAAVAAPAGPRASDALRFDQYFQAPATQTPPGHAVPPDADADADAAPPPDATDDAFHAWLTRLGRTS